MRPRRVPMRTPSTGLFGCGGRPRYLREKKPADTLDEHDHHDPDRVPFVRQLITGNLRRSMNHADREAEQQATDGTQHAPAKDPPHHSEPPAKGNSRRVHLSIRHRASSTAKRPVSALFSPSGNRRHLTPYGLFSLPPLSRASGRSSGRSPGRHSSATGAKSSTIRSRRPAQTTTATPCRAPQLRPGR